MIGVEVDVWVGGVGGDPTDSVHCFFVVGSSSIPSLLSLSELNRFFELLVVFCDDETGRGSSFCTVGGLPSSLAMLPM